MNRPHPYPGLYIAFEGIVGTGKSTQIPLLRGAIEQAFFLEPVVTREPGGTPQAEKVREIVKSKRLKPHIETTLFAVARRDTLSKIVIPALVEGSVVISDRSVLSSLAYQGSGRSLGQDVVWKTNQEIVGKSFVLPDCIVYFDLPVEVALERSGRLSPDKFDREEQKFWGRTVDGFRAGLEFLRSVNSGLHVVIVDASPPQELVREAIWRGLCPLLEGWAREGRVVRETTNKGKEVL